MTGYVFMRMLETYYDDSSPFSQDVEEYIRETYRETQDFYNALNEYYIIFHYKPDELQEP